MGRAATAIGVAAGLVGFGAAETTPALADSAPTYQVYNTLGEGLELRTAPTATSSAITNLADGTNLELDCWAEGQDVAGISSVWDSVTVESTGQTGYVSDAYVNTPEVNDGAVLTQDGVAECGGDSAVPTTGPQMPPTDPNPEYDRTAAVEWALANAEDPQTNGSECAKFVSEALWAGGLPQTSTWNNSGGYVSRLNYFDGTETANTVPNLVQYLEEHYSVQWESLGNMTDNDVPLAQPGDIIIYSWPGNGKLDHMALVVGDANSNSRYPFVSEWGNFAPWQPSYDVFNPSSPYIERGWTWSDMNNEWLEQKYPGATAYLLHSNGGYYTASGNGS